MSAKKKNCSEFDLTPAAEGTRTVSENSNMKLFHALAVHSVRAPLASNQVVAMLVEGQFRQLQTTRIQECTEGDQREDTNYHTSRDDKKLGSATIDVRVRVKDGTMMVVTPVMACWNWIFPDVRNFESLRGKKEAAHLAPNPGPHSCRQHQKNKGH